MAGMKKGGGEEGLRERWQGEGRRGPEKDGRYEEEGRGGGARRKMAGMKKGGGVEEDAGIKKGWCGRRWYGRRWYDKGGGKGDSLLEEHGEHHLISLLGKACEEEDLVRCLLA